MPSRGVNASLRQTTLRELLLAAVAGAVTAASPLSTSDWRRSAVAGVLVGGAVLGYRLRRLRTAPATAVEDSAAPRLHISPSLLVAGFLFVGVFAPTLRWLYAGWTHSVWSNNHSIFIPFLVAYLAYITLRDDRDREERSSAWGFVWLATGLLLAASDAAVRTYYLSVVGLLITLPGLSLLLLGSRRTRMLTVPLVVSWLMVPIPNTVGSHLYLRWATSAALEPILYMMGIPAFREMTVITMRSHTFVVSDACSGFATMYASIAVSIILACYTRSTWRRVLLILLAPALALGANIVRVLMLILLTEEFGSWIIDSPVHPGSGVVAFFGVTVALFLIAGKSSIRSAPA